MAKVSSVFIETLKNHKVDRFFCVPGESYLPVMNELVSNPIIDVVTCRHEGGAGFMAVADAWRWQSRNPDGYVASSDD